MSGRHHKKNKSKNHPQVPVVPETRQNDTATRKTDAETREEIKPMPQEKNKSWIPAATLFIAVVVAAIYFFQLREMVHSNAINREALESVQRAFLNCPTMAYVRHLSMVSGNPQPASYWFFTMPCENSGTTPANVTAQAFFGDIINREPSETEFLKSPLIENILIGPKSVRDIGTATVPDKQIFGKELPIKITDLQKLSNETTAPWVFWGWVVYQDAFKGTEPHITEFCQRMTKAMVNTSDPQGRIVFDFATCEHHNCADRYCDDYDQVKKLSTK